LPRCSSATQNGRRTPYQRLRKAQVADDGGRATPTVAQGLAIIQDDPKSPLDGAILDVNIGGEKVYPVAEALAAKGVPFIFATGYGIGGISEAFSHVPALAKPYETRSLERLLSSTLNRPASPGS